MAEQKHPITPPQELLQQWAVDYWGNPGESIGEGEKYIATQAARWGDEQRLNAVCEWLDYNYPAVNCAALRAAMHPKPPSLAEQALNAAKDMSDCMEHGFVPKRSSLDTISAALKRLQELELEKINE